MKRFIFSIFLIFISFNSTAIQSCINGETKKAPATGAIFTCDTTTTLKNAWRDPDGLIWSTVRKTVDGAFILARIDSAEYSCANRDFRLPTQIDFEKLAVFLGINTEAGYSTLDANGNLILPFLLDFGRDYPLWTSTKNQSYPNLMHAFNAGSGRLDSIPIFYESVFVCVTQ